MKTILLIFGCLLIAASALAQGGGSSPVLHPAAYANARQWKNIMDFGAKGDGVTDDRAAIDSAIAAVPDSGGTVFVPHSASGFLITNTIRIPSYVRLVGVGIGSVIRMHPDSSRAIIANADTVNGDTGIVIENILFDGNKSYSLFSDRDSADCISLINVHRSTVRNCWVTRTDADGIALRQSTDCTIEGNTVWETGEDCITVAGLTSLRNIVSGNHIEGRDTSYDVGGIPSGILCKSSEVIISNNRVRYGGAAVDINNESGDTLREIIVIGNTFQNCFATTVSIGDGYHIIVSSNIFYDCQGPGIFTWASGPFSHDITITGNSFYGQAGIAIKASSGDNYVISNNVIVGTDTTAIQAAGDHVTITANRVDTTDAGDGIHLQSTRYSSITANVVSKAANRGIYSEGGSSGGEYTTISDNTIRFSGGPGIYLSSSDFLSISGNICVDNDSAGIWLNGSHNNEIIGNVCTSPADLQEHGVVITGSTRNTVSNNQLGGNVTGATSGMSGNLEYGNREDTSTTSQLIVHNNIGIGATNPQLSLVIDTISPAIYLNATDTGGIAAGNASIRFDSAGTLGFSLIFTADSTSEFLIRDHITTTNSFGISRLGAITFAETYTFPIIDGTAGYVLETNGSGALSWQPNDTIGVAGGSADSIGIDSSGDGTPDVWAYSVGNRGIFTLSEGTNIIFTLTGDTLDISAVGGSGAWTTAGDTAHLIDADNDTLARFWDNDAGAVTWDIGADQSTLHIVGKADTGDYLGADTVRVFVTNRVDTLTANMILNGGNIVMASTETVDGVDVSAHAADEDGHHNRNHNIYGSTDHNATAYRLFYSDASSIVQQLAHGASGQVLTANGVSADPTWQAAPGGGGADSAGIYDGNSDHWSVDKAWLLTFGYGLKWVDSLKDSGGVYDTGTVIVDTADAVADAEPLPVTGNAVYDYVIANYMSNVGDTTTGTYNFSGGPLEFVRMIDFDDTITAPAHSEGRVFYDKTDNTLSYYNNDPDVEMNIGQEGWVYVRNVTGSTILDGKVVSITGAVSSRPTITLAKADDVDSCKLLGVATHDIETATNGYVTIWGVVHGINLSGFSDGDEVFLSAAVAGNLTTVQPSAPNCVIEVGYVIDASANGDLFVLLGKNKSLNMLQDVLISGPVTGDMLIYDGTVWADSPFVPLWVAVNDTAFLIDADGDTLAAFWDDDAGNVGWQVATEDQTLLLLLDTIVLGDDTMSADHIPAYLVRLQIHNATGITLAQGLPVYISGATGDIPNADSARADNASLMPAVGLVEHNITNGNDGYAVVSGKVEGLNTVGLSEGDAVYVAPTGGWTTTKPTGTDLIQKIGQVTRVNPANGDIYVSGAGRINDIPNMPDSHLWVGNGSGVATAVDMTGDVTMSNTGVTSIAANAVESTMIGPNEVNDLDINFGTGTDQVGMADMIGSNWQVFYTNGSGLIIELPIGASGLVLKSNGVAAAPTWQADATGSGAWDEIDGATKDTVRWVAPNADTALVIESDGSGNTILTVGNESDNTETTLRVKADTLDLGGDVISEFAGTGLNVTSNELRADLGTSIEAIEIADADHGDFTYSTGVATLDVGVVDSGNVATNSLSMSGDLQAFTKAELEGRTSDVADYAEADGDTWTGVHDFGGATSTEMPNGANPTTDAAGEYAYDTDDSAIEVYVGSYSALIPVLKKMEVLIWNPDLITDTVPIFFVDSAIYQGGIKILSAEVQTSVDGTYALKLMSFTAADPPVFHDWIDTLNVGASDQRVSSITFEDANASSVDVGQFVYILTPATDIDWIRVSIRYYVKDND